MLFGLNLIGFFFFFFGFIIFVEDSSFGSYSSFVVLTEVCLPEESRFLFVICLLLVPWGMGSLWLFAVVVLVTFSLGVCFALINAPPITKNFPSIIFTLWLVFFLVWCCLFIRSCLFVFFICLFVWHSLLLVVCDCSFLCLFVTCCCCYCVLMLLSLLPVAFRFHDLSTIAVGLCDGTAVVLFFESVASVGLFWL